MNLNNFNRFFTFGCSFTNFIWPTWADILANEMTGTKFYNLGMSGAGNLMISARVVEAHKRFNFTENDLVMVMFTSFYREDRYVKGSWLPRGNVYNNGIYKKDFLEKYADPVGYLIRDFALIEMTTSFLKQLPCKSVFLMSADVDEDLTFGKLMYDFKDTDNPNTSMIVDLYKDTLESFPTSLKKFVTNGKNVWPIGYSYKWDGRNHNDSHPNPKMYLDYLKHLNFNLTEKSEHYVTESMEKLKLCVDKNDFSRIFPEIDQNTTVSKTVLF